MNHTVGGAALVQRGWWSSLVSCERYLFAYFDVYLVLIKSPDTP